MSRVKRGVHRSKRRHYILARTKGYMWGRKSKITVAKVAALKAGAYAYRDRRTRKRDFRALWNIRINAGARLHGITYSRLIAALKKQKISLDRKILATLAAEYPALFRKVIKTAQGA